MTPFGNFDFKKVPFGLVQGPTHFQKLINKVLKGIPFTSGYLDNILVFSENKEKHLKQLRTVFDRLQAADLKLKRTKCDVLKSEPHYLGHLISGKDIYPLPEKLQSIRDLTLPKHLRKLDKC